MKERERERASAAEGDEEADAYQEYQEQDRYSYEDTYHASTQEWYAGDEEGEWDPEDPEGYEEE
eukprot:11936009-Prorocentrum_lima.AAC.1